MEFSPLIGLVPGANTLDRSGSSPCCSGPDALLLLPLLLRSFRRDLIRPFPIFVESFFAPAGRTVPHRRAAILHLGKFFSPFPSPCPTEGDPHPRHTFNSRPHETHHAAITGWSAYHVAQDRPANRPPGGVFIFSSGLPFFVHSFIRLVVAVCALVRVQPLLAKEALTPPTRALPPYRQNGNREIHGLQRGCVGEQPVRAQPHCFHPHARETHDGVPLENVSSFCCLTFPF
ncbi:hypothetical protein VTK26DRAFT_1428 [Humicola hyalothermophila]